MKLPVQGSSWLQCMKNSIQMRRMLHIIQYFIMCFVFVCYFCCFLTVVLIVVANTNTHHYLLHCAIFLLMGQQCKQSCLFWHLQDIFCSMAGLFRQGWGRDLHLVLRMEYSLFPDGVKNYVGFCDDNSDGSVDDDAHIIWMKMSKLKSNVPSKCILD